MIYIAQFWWKSSIDDPVISLHHISIYKNILSRNLDINNYWLSLINEINNNFYIRPDDFYLKIKTHLNLNEFLSKEEWDSIQESITKL